MCLYVLLYVNGVLASRQSNLRPRFNHNYLRGSVFLGKEAFFSRIRPYSPHY